MAFGSIPINPNTPYTGTSSIPTNPNVPYSPPTGMTGIPTNPNQGYLSNMFQSGNTPTNPYPNGFSVSGTGANNSPTNFTPQWNPNSNLWTISGGNNTSIPLFNNTNQLPGGVTANQTTSQPETSAGLVSGSQPTTTTNYGYNFPGQGGLTTSGSYTLDPKTGYYVPGDMRTQNPNASNVMDYAIPAVALGGAAGVVGAAAMGAGAAGAASGTAGAAEGTGATAFPVAAQGAASTTPMGALSGYGATGAGTAGAGGLASLGGGAGVDATAGGVLPSGAGLGTGGAGGAGTASTLPSWLQNAQQVGSGLNSLFGQGSPLGGLVNTAIGNNSNRNTASDLMGMYTNAGNIAGPSTTATNNLISNPASYFNSPMYQSLASLYGNNVNAGKNAAGTNGNTIDYTQKMMGFGAQNYLNTLGTLGGISNNYLTNQARYGQDYAYGTALGNTSSGAAAGSALGSLGGILGNLGGIYNGFSNIGNGLSGLF